MTTDRMHYLGFIHTCESCGLEKSAADRLYKIARGQSIKTVVNAAGRVGEALGFGAKKTRQVGRTVQKTTRDVANKVGKGVRKATKAVVEPIGNAASTARVTAQRAGSAFTKGFRKYNPAPRGGRTASRARSTASALAFSPWKATKNFVMKHPVLSTIGGVTLGAGLTHWADRASMDDNKSKLPTLTPSEKLMFDRAANGFNLPGLGLDPTFFSGEELPAYW